MTSIVCVRETLRETLKATMTDMQENTRYKRANKSFYPLDLNLTVDTIVVC